MTILPKKILIRKDDITRLFFILLDNHIYDILSGNIDIIYKIKDFANLLDLHPTYFSSVIKLTTKKSPNDFIEERIVDEAKKMLTETSLPISEICKKLAFKEATNFTKFFKSMAGMTPKEFRKRKS